MIVGVWPDGRIGTIRGNRRGNSEFGGVVHRENGSQPVETNREPREAKYARLLERVMELFRTGVPAVDVDELLETIRFMEAANASRSTGNMIPLESEPLP